MESPRVSSWDTRTPGHPGSAAPRRAAPWEGCSCQLPCSHLHRERMGWGGPSALWCCGSAPSLGQRVTAAGCLQLRTFLGRVHGRSMTSWQGQGKIKEQGKSRGTESNSWNFLCSHQPKPRTSFWFNFRPHRATGGENCLDLESSDRSFQFQETVNGPSQDIFIVARGSERSLALPHAIRAAFQHF